MAVTTLTPPESITFDLDHERKKRLVSSSRHSTHTTLSSPPERTSPVDATCSQDAIITPESDSGRDSPPGVVPKLEEFEDDGTGALSKFAELKDAKALTALTALPRKRGRPRIHPVVEQKKSAHARSKTGCGTCRRRKKKCDEAQPHCQNCAKNNVICTGYDEKKMWRSGKQKVVERRKTPMMPPLPTGFAGVETAMDYRFLEYFEQRLGTVLSVTDNYNPFTTVILPMALEDTGLMKSVLYLSGSCLVANEIDPPMEMLDRLADHNIQSIEPINKVLHQLRLAGEDDASTAVVPVDDASIAATLLRCLQTVCAGTLDGSWRHHVLAMKILLSHQSPSSDWRPQQFRKFMLEFLLYHDYSSSVTSFGNPLDDRTTQFMQELQSTSVVDSEAATLLGVMDGLFGYISRIRTFRDEIREKRQKGIRNGSYGSAWLLQDELQKWQCHYPEGTPRYWASLLYRQCVFLHLHRTIRESKPCVQFKQGVDEGLHYLRQLPQDEDDSATQSILLLPVFLLGCSAFEPEQRVEIRHAFERLQKWSTLGNIKHAKVIVEEIWTMMDDGRADETWDWEAVMANRQWDFLIT